MRMRQNQTRPKRGRLGRFVNSLRLGGSVTLDSEKSVRHSKRVPSGGPKEIGNPYWCAWTIHHLVGWNGNKKLETVACLFSYLLRKRNLGELAGDRQSLDVVSIELISLWACESGKYSQATDNQTETETSPSPHYLQQQDNAGQYRHAGIAADLRSGRSCKCSFEYQERRIVFIWYVGLILLLCFRNSLRLLFIRRNAQLY